MFMIVYDYAGTTCELIRFIIRLKLLKGPHTCLGFLR